MQQDELLREKIAEAMQRRLNANPTVSEIAQDLGMSTRHLSKLCRRLFNEGPARLHLRLKLRRAEQLLRHEGLRVNEASDALGFANPFHFSRVYRRVMGHPPSELK